MYHTRSETGISLQTLRPALSLQRDVSATRAKDQQRATPRPTSFTAISDNHQAVERATDQTQAFGKTKWRLFSACLMNLGNGMSDSAPGALIPYIETDYHIGYAIVSMIFIANAVGFILAAPLSHTIKTQLGQSKSYALSMCLITAGCIIIDVSRCIWYWWRGFSLIATAMVSNGIRWTFFYLVPVVISTTNLIFSTWAFSGYVENTESAAAGPTPTPDNSDSPSRLNVLKEALKNRTTILGALFIFAYQGAEVSISGWVVSFLISYRGGDPSRVGYVSAGFWAGITLGRFLLVYPSNRIGNKIAVSLMIFGATAFQLVTWLVPNIVGEAVAVAVVGLLLGPIFPCATAVFAKLLPRSVQLPSLSFVTALGSSGGAVFPFLTGILAQGSVGTMVLHPVCLGLYAVMCVGWWGLPRISKRSE